MSIELTAEQERVASCPAKTLVVNAFAGTGKTSVLVEYAKRRPGKRMIYLAFNRSIKEEASRRFPNNVRCVTTHGLAFPAFGVRVKDKLGNPKASHVSRLLGCDLLTAGYVLATLTNFMASPDFSIGEIHALLASPKAGPETVGLLVDYARKTWAAMADPGCPGVPAPHDLYLKQFQASLPVIRTDTLMFDEAQDANPATIDLVMRQNCGKVIVGDKYQSIYSFRGAVDALSMVKADETLLISESFRFGPGIAKIASCLLSDWRGEPNPVTGKGRYQSVFSVNPNAPHAIVARTNGQIFSEAVALVLGKKPFGFAGGVEGYRFDLIMDTYRLYAKQNSEIRDPFIASFADFYLLRQYAEELDDREIKSVVNVVSEYQHSIPRLIEQIRTKAVPVLIGNEIVLSTSHKSKGLEWMDVVLTNDYTDLLVKENGKTGELVSPSAEEIHVLYVAATRAMRGLQLPSTVHDWLANSGRTDLLRLITNNTGANSIAAQNTADKSIKERFGTIEAQIAELRTELTNTPSAASALAHYLREQASLFEKMAS